MGFLLSFESPLVVSEVPKIKIKMSSESPVLGPEDRFKRPKKDGNPMVLRKSIESPLAVKSQVKTY